MVFSLVLNAQSKKEDSLLNVLKTEEVDSVIYKTNVALTLYYLDTHNEKKLISVAQEIIRIGKKSGNDSWTGVGYRILGDYYRYWYQN